MVKTFDMRNSLISLGYDLQKKASSIDDPNEVFFWAKNRLYRIKHEENQFNKFNSKEYKNRNRVDYNE